MYCNNCGKENDDSVAFCSHCGKSPNEGTEKTTNWAKKTTSWTVNFIQGCFPWVFAAMFWLTVIGSMVGGAKTVQAWYTFISTDYVGDEEKMVALIVGGIIGLVVGFVVAVWTSGVVATLLKMDKNLQYLADKEKAKG